MRKWLLILFGSLLLTNVVSAQTIIGNLPFTLQNGTIADANQVMSDLNTIVSSVNANAANAGANTNITALNGLTTPLVYTSGGTSSYIGGTSSGSANAQVIASPIPSGFNLITGKSIIFVAGFTNTGPTTLNVNATGVTNVFRQTASGAVAMVGGEIVTGQVYTAVFDGTEFQLQGLSPQNVVQPCTVIDWVGANGGPSGYLLMNGQAVSRTTYATLFSCISVQSVSATTSNGSASVVVSNSALFQIGWSVGGNNVTCNSTIIAIPDGTHITISNTAGASGATTLTIGPYSQGDCSTTFGVGNFLGRATVMRDTGGTVLTATTCTNPASIGSSCGQQTNTLLTGNLPPYTPSGTISNGSISLNGSIASAVNGAQGAMGVDSSGAGPVNLSSTITVSQGTSTFSGNAQGGTSTAFTNLPPAALVDKYIKF